MKSYNDHKAKFSDYAKTVWSLLSGSLVACCCADVVSRERALHQGGGKNDVGHRLSD